MTMRVVVRLDETRYTPESGPINSFTCDNKRYWFLRMVMGHRNSSAQFAHLMDLLLSDIDIRELCYFLDDILPQLYEQNFYKIQNTAQPAHMLYLLSL